MAKKRPVLQIFSADTTTELLLPLVDSGISAGFPSPAQDYLDLRLDLNKELISNPSSTFLGRVKGQSMKDAVYLIPANPAFEPIKVTEENNFYASCERVFNLRPENRARHNQKHRNFG